MARRTKEAALETRNRILDTAEQLFLERGVSRTSLEMIAAAAGLTRGAIYWHFRNKADLFDAMMARVVLPMEEMAARAAQEDPSDPLDHVRDCALNVLDHLMTDPRCRRVFEICCHKVEYVDEMMGVRQRQIEARNGCLQHMERGLRDAARKGLLAPSVEPRRAAMGLHALVDGFIMNWILDPRSMPLGGDARILVEQYLDGLRAAPSRAPVRRADARRNAESAEIG